MSKQANVLFDHMFNTQIEFRPPGLDMNAEAKAVTERLRQEGRKPYFISEVAQMKLGHLAMCQQHKNSSSNVMRCSCHPNWLSCLQEVQAPMPA